MEGGGDRRGKGEKDERKRWKGESEKVNDVKVNRWTRWMVNGVNLMNMVYVANGKKVNRSKGQMWLFVKRDGVLTGSWILLLIGTCIFRYKISSIYNKVVLTRVHYCMFFDNYWYLLVFNNLNITIFTFTYSLSLFHFCQMWLLTFWPFDLLTFLNLPPCSLPMPIFLRRDVAIPASRRNNSRVAT